MTVKIPDSLPWRLDRKGGTDILAHNGDLVGETYGEGYGKGRADAVLRTLAQYASAYEPSVRIIGNIRAGDIVRALSFARPEPPADLVERVRSAWQSWIAGGCHRSEHEFIAALAAEYAAEWEARAERLEEEQAARAAVIRRLNAQIRSEMIKTEDALTRAVAAEQALAEERDAVSSLLSTLEAVRSEFRVEYTDDGRFAGASHDSSAIPLIIGLLDAAIRARKGGGDDTGA